MVSAGCDCAGLGEIHRTLYLRPAEKSEADGELVDVEAVLVLIHHAALINVPAFTEYRLTRARLVR